MPSPFLERQPADPHAESRMVGMSRSQRDTLAQVIRAWTFDGCDSGYLHPEEVRRLKAMRVLLDAWDAAPGITS